MNTTTVHPTALVPNHHADHPGFGGVSGLIAALSFNIGREDDADLAVRLAGVTASDDVVDIGCGPGVAARRAAAAGASSVIGIDPAPVMLRIGRLTPHRHGRARLRYIEGTAESLPLADRSASVVWSLATVHHWHDIVLGLAEVRRVLRPGGTFLAIERRVKPGATGHRSHGWIDDQAHALADLAQDVGLTGTEVEQHRSGQRTVLSVLARAPG